MKEPISRADAKVLGLKFYFTGEACRAGHVVDRYTKSGGCVTCTIERASRSYQENPSATAERSRKRKAANPGLVAAEKAAHYLKNKEKITARRQQNKASIAKTAAKYYVENKAAIAIYGAKWQASNRHYLSSRRKARYSSDPDFRRSELIRDIVKRMVRATKAGRPAKAFELCGYLPNEFRAHIEGLFNPGMTWANHGKWHVDHVKPLSELIRSGVTDPKAVNRLSNLQPLWAVENLEKGERQLSA
ncbi:hypothetical protein [Pseudomonas sp. MF7448]|uniref:hypothetical protein n=1 Tax=Pseudomonas sp. MF7448 TaxID=2797537 RepID=UPI00190CA13B|nr:hypothetical protein [Pseudomonas sp. MF7448]MBK3438769.1 hypothetical protein [Pseudomonas sp. MF7448]